MKIGQILSLKGRNVLMIGPRATLADVVDRLVEANIGSLLVEDAGQFVGIITERDILRASASRRTRLDELRVSDHMTTDVITGSSEDEVTRGMGLMTENRIRHLPIMDDGQLVGMISIGDLVKAQHEELQVENHYLKTYIQS